MKKLGQHFLKNISVIEGAVKALELKHGDQIIEIGPGHGELTNPLLNTAKKVGALVTSIETDRKLIPALMELQKGMPGSFEIVEGDALKLLPEIIERFSKSSAQSSHYKIIGNIPYYITGKLLRVISELEYKPERTILLIQKEVAERICAKPPEMNRLAASVQFWAEPKIIAHVGRKDFTPPPEVDSELIVLKTLVADKNTISEDHYYKAVRGIFAQPRKNLINNIAGAQKNGSGEVMAKEEIVKSLEVIGLEPNYRPQNLAITDIVAIAKAFF